MIDHKREQNGEIGFFFPFLGKQEKWGVQEGSAGGEISIDE